MKQRRLTGTFPATDDAGRSYTVNVYTTTLQDEGFEGQADPPIGPIPTELVTVDGRKLNRRAKGEYEDIVTGKVLRSTDPAAP